MSLKLLVWKSVCLLAGIPLLAQQSDRGTISGRYPVEKLKTIYVFAYSNGIDAWSVVSGEDGRFVLDNLELKEYRLCFYEVPPYDRGILRVPLPLGSVSDTMASGRIKEELILFFREWEEAFRTASYEELRMYHTEPYLFTRKHYNAIRAAGHRDEILRREILGVFGDGPWGILVHEGSVGFSPDGRMYWVNLGHMYSLYKIKREGGRFKIYDHENVFYPAALKRRPWYRGLAQIDFVIDANLTNIRVRAGKETRLSEIRSRLLLTESKRVGR